VASSVKIPSPLRVIGTSFVDWWDSWLDMVMVTIVWFVAQLTIVLGPPATFGFYYVVYRMVTNGEATGLRGLFEGAKKYFGKAWIWGLINIAVVVLMYVNFTFYSNIEAFWSFSLVVLLGILSLFWLFTQFYAIPFLMEQEDKRLKVALKNGILTSLASPFFTFFVMIVVILIVFLCVGFVIPTFLGLPAVIPFLGFRALNDRLVSFGLRKPEKTPKEIEFEQGSRINVPELDRTVGDGGGAAGTEVSDGEGKIEQEE